eukprot:4511578-Pyramimonas_sp.AAC.1
MGGMSSSARAMTNLLPRTPRPEVANPGPPVSMPKQQGSDISNCRGSACAMRGGGQAELAEEERGEGGRALALGKGGNNSEIDRQREGWM